MILSYIFYDAKLNDSKYIISKICYEQKLYLIEYIIDPKSCEKYYDPKCYDL